MTAECLNLAQQIYVKRQQQVELEAFNIYLS